MGSPKEEYKSRPRDTKRYKNMTTKGASAEGARPHCGAADGRPHVFVYVLYLWVWICICLCIYGRWADAWHYQCHFVERCRMQMASSLHEPSATPIRRVFLHLILRQRPTKDKLKAKVQIFAK